MRIKTKQELVMSTPKRWTKQYEGTDNFKHAKITETLNKTKPNTEKEVIDIIGNVSWTRLSCSACGSDEEIAIEFIKGIIHEQDAIVICEDCLKNALSMINSVKVIK